MARSSAFSVLLIGSVFGFAFGCGQEIVVSDVCTDHDAGASDGSQVGDQGVDDRGPEDRGSVDGPNPPEDSGLSGDGGVGDNGQASDGGATDCVNAGYCIVSFVPDKPTANVRELVTLAVTLRNDGATPLTLRVDPLEVVAQRPVNRPALQLPQIRFSYALGAPNEATFRVEEVPPWFIATTFRLRISASAVGGPEVSQEAMVHIRGNTLYADSAVFAVASDGLPAKNVDTRYTRSELIDLLVGSPKGLLLSRDGTLLVYDSGSTPHRMLRFILDWEDNQLDIFDTLDANQDPVIRESNGAFYSLAELADGGVAVIDYSFTGSPSSRIVIWNQDGSFRRAVSSLSPSVRWQGLTINPAGQFVVMTRGTPSQILTIDPMFGNVIGTPLDMPRSGWGVLSLTNGDAYAFGDGFALFLPAAGGTMNINGLPGNTVTYWRAASPAGAGRVIIGSDEADDTDNLQVIEGRTILGDARLPDMGNPVVAVTGVAYLE